MLLAWVVFPLVLGLLALGCGLLLERVTAARLPGPLLLPSGFAVIVVAAGFTTLSDATAELTAPLVLGFAVAGLGLSLPRRRTRFEGWPLAAAVGVFAAYAAPVVLSGEATFAGYLKLDDTATWLAITDRIMEHGRSLDGLEPSSYEATLDGWLANGYPLGSLFTLGIGHELVREDSAWLHQPHLAFLAALLAFCAYELVRPLVRSGALRAFIAFVASQAALLYGYALWGGVKELATVPVVALLAALVPVFLARPGVRAVIPLAVATAALMAILSPTGGVWLLPVAATAVLAALRLSLNRFALAAGAFAVAAVLLSIPALVEARTFLQSVEAGGVLRLESELGNLLEPLNALQIFGIWPTGDFRFDPDELELTYILIAVACLAGAAGLGLSVRARAFGLPLYIAAAALGAVASALVGSPWVDAKALTIASPAFVLAALAGAAAFFERGRRVEAVLAGAAIAGGVLWSNALAYHEVWLAPRDKLAELEQIGERFAGQGPTLMTEFQTYGVRHFLREADPEGASEFRRRLIPLRDGTILQGGAFADLDRFQLAGLLEYHTLVLRRSPVASRPPSAFRLVEEGRYYEVWQQRPGARPIAEHLPLGEGEQPAAVPPCTEVQRLAQLAGPGGTLAAVPRPPAIIAGVGLTSDSVAADSEFEMEREVTVSSAGRHGVWVGNTFKSRVEVAVDRAVVGDARHQLKPDHYLQLGEIQLRAGLHRLRLHYRGPDLRPGSGGSTVGGLGPLVLSRETAVRPIVPVSASNARSLCGKRLDWVEALRS